MTRYAYILVSGKNDLYAAMCLVSVVSVRGIDPDANITILSTDQTVSRLKQQRHPLLELADEILICPVEAAPLHQSRFIKTTLLQRLGGDFVFLDVDTVLVRPIAHRLTAGPSLQMALDRVEKPPKVGFPKNMISHYEHLGWEWPTPQYFNSGIIFVRCAPDSERLFAEWHRRWRLSLAAGLHQDQPALNSSLAALQVPVGRLPVSYNAMVRVDETFRQGARVLHFFAEGHRLETDVEYTRLVAAAHAGQTLTPLRIQAAMNRRWPMVHPGSIRRQLQVGNLTTALDLCLHRVKAGHTDRKWVR